VSGPRHLRKGARPGDPVYDLIRVGVASSTTQTTITAEPCIVTSASCSALSASGYAILRHADSAGEERDILKSVNGVGGAFHNFGIEEGLPFDNGLHVSLSAGGGVLACIVRYVLLRELELMREETPVDPSGAFGKTQNRGRRGPARGAPTTPPPGDDGGATFIIDGTGPGVEIKEGPAS
jgi:hypothetical protein